MYRGSALCTARGARDIPCWECKPNDAAAAHWPAGTLLLSSRSPEYNLYYTGNGVYFGYGCYTAPGAIDTVTKSANNFSWPPVILFTGIHPGPSIAIL